MNLREEQIRRAALYGYDAPTFGALETSDEPINMFGPFIRGDWKNDSSPKKALITPREVFQQQFSHMSTYSELVQVLKQVGSETVFSNDEFLKNLACAYNHFLDVCMGLMSKLNVEVLIKLTPHKFIKMLSFHLRENEQSLFAQLKNNDVLSTQQLADHLLKIATILDQEKQRFIKEKSSPRLVV